MGPAWVKLMPSEYCFNLLDTITLVHSVHFKRFLKVMQFICSIHSLNLLAVRKPFNNLVRVFLNLALLQLKLDIWTAKAVILPLKIYCYWIYFIMSNQDSDVYKFIRLLSCQQCEIHCAAVLGQKSDTQFLVRGHFEGSRQKHKNIQNKK